MYFCKAFSTDKIFMKDKRVLIISSEVVPYLPQTEQAVNSFKIPKAINDKGGQTRIFIPKYGIIQNLPSSPTFYCDHCIRNYKLCLN